MLTDGLNINEKGHLTIGGCDTVELAETYGTPLYVMNEEVIRQALRAYVQSMETYYPQGGRVAYASKACCFLEMYRIAAQEGCGADVVSGGELYTALRAGMPGGTTVFPRQQQTGGRAAHGIGSRRGPDRGGQSGGAAPVVLDCAGHGQHSSDPSAG